MALLLSCPREFGFSTPCLRVAPMPFMRLGIYLYLLRSAWTLLTRFLQQWVCSSEFAVDRAELWVWNVVMARRRWLENDSGSEVVLWFVVHVHVHSLPLRRK